MSALFDSLKELTPEHRRALEWFWNRRDTVIPWPKPLDGLLLVSKAKGIRRPKGWAHALSLRQTINSPYADAEPKIRLDGSWSYDYFQEGHDPADRDKHATNRGLLACIESGTPVAVLIQLRAKPTALYTVLGLARVTGWTAGYFHLDGFNTSGEFGRTLSASQADFSYPPATATEPAVVAEGYSPIDASDARKKIDAQILARQGGRKFRDTALLNFDRRCAISDCQIDAVLEAAHIVPYRGPQTNGADNALLLRTDLHTLFDRQLLIIDPKTLRVTLDERLTASEYVRLEGQLVRLPKGSDAATLSARLIERAEALGVTSP
jgi:putative restriction endonuclease